MNLVVTDLKTGQNYQILTRITGQSLDNDLDVAKIKAKANMMEKAKEIGADDVIGVRYICYRDAIHIHGIIASGTAIKYV